MGLAEGCQLRRNVPKDQVLAYDDVDLPAGRLCDRLRAEQTRYFACFEPVTQSANSPGIRAQ